MRKSLKLHVERAAMILLKSYQMRIKQLLVKVAQHSLAEKSSVYLLPVLF